MRLLAPRLGLDHPAFQESDEEIAAAALPNGVTIEALKRDGWRKVAQPRPDPAAGPAILRFAGDDPMPMPVESDALRLLTPKSHYFLNSSFANMPRQRKAQGKPALEMHKITRLGWIRLD